MTSNRIRTVVALLCFASAVASAAPGSAADEHWVAAAAPKADLAWSWNALQVQGPAALRCGSPSHEFVRLPAAGLMQGTLGATPQQAERRAKALGVKRFPVATHRVNCDNASFDLHLVGVDRALLGWDGQVLSLRRSDAASTPLATVQRLVEVHLGSEMAFTPSQARALSRWMTPALNRRIAAYFARPRPQDEVPPIDGDPWTNSQEEPDKVMLQAGPVQADAATVLVQFEGEGRRWQLTYRLRQVGGQWRIEDIESPDGPSFSTLLRS